MVNRRTTMRGIATLVLLAGAWLHAQPATPTITSLQSSPPGEGEGGPPGPTNGAAITAGSPYQSFDLYINGSFLIEEGVVNDVTWTPGGGQAVPLGILTSSATQIVVSVPADLYATPGTATVMVIESFEEAEGGPAPAMSMFTVNPAMSGGGALPPGYVGLSYAQPFFSGGTAPFSIAPFTAPPGLTYTANAGNPLFGTPRQAGALSVTATITDSWNNPLTLNDPIQI